MIYGVYFVTRFTCFFITNVSFEFVGLLLILFLQLGSRTEKKILNYEILRLAFTVQNLQKAPKSTPVKFDAICFKVYQVMYTLTKFQAFS